MCWVAAHHRQVAEVELVVGLVALLDHARQLLDIPGQPIVGAQRVELAVAVQVAKRYGIGTAIGGKAGLLREA